MAESCSLTQLVVAHNNKFINEAILRKYILLIVLLFTGCATAEGYRQLVQNWVGRSESDLVKTWGPPQSSYAMNDGSKVLQYFKSQSAYIPGYTYNTPVTTYHSGSVYGSTGYNYLSGTSTTYVPKTTPGTFINTECTTNFIISSQGKVASFNFEGNSCRAYQPLEVSGVQNPSVAATNNTSFKDWNLVRNNNVCHLISRPKKYESINNMLSKFTGVEEELKITVGKNKVYYYFTTDNASGDSFEIKIDDNKPIKIEAETHGAQINVKKDSTLVQQSKNGSTLALYKNKKMLSEYSLSGFASAYNTSKDCWI